MNYQTSKNIEDGLPTFIKVISNDKIFALLRDQDGRTGYDLIAPMKEDEDVSLLRREDYEIIKGYTKEESHTFLDNGEWESIGFWELCEKYGY